MIYFDNAATGYFKPRCVCDAVNTVINYLCANPGRSGHRLSIAGAQTVQKARKVLADYFEASEERVIFTKNCTEALNYAIFGSLVQGGHVITTVYEHNSVLRPLNFLKEKGLIQLSIVHPTKTSTLQQEIEKNIQSNTYLIATTAVSNVTGEQLPIEEIGLIAKKHNLLYLVDGAQGGGHMPLCMRKMNISFLALAGHKGLYGIMGSGALILSNDSDLTPIIMGGTGSESFNMNQPTCYPERLEAGTLNLPAIVSMLEGAKYIKNHQEPFATYLFDATAYLIEQLNKIQGVSVYSSPNRAGIVSFNLDKKDSVLVADLLNSKYDIAVRGGLHCAPLMHEYLNTSKQGLVRASLAVQNSTNEINMLIRAVKSISNQ